MAHMMRFCCDDETGEVMTYEVNKETGEELVVGNIAPTHRQARVMPIYQPVLGPQKRMKLCKFPSHGYYSRTKKFQNLKANIIAGSNTISHRLLLIPTLIFSTALCALLMIFEIFLHIHCHKKNKTLKDSNMYHRSPFHTITSMFCGVCRDSDTASKIGQLQDKRRTRYDYFRGIAI